jgi:hypothetical protein
MPAREYACTKARFLQDVERHEMTIVRDDGVHRHLRFKRPQSSCYFFDLITYPGSLVIDGDCGTYVFRRLPDMFEFFRADKTDRDINPGYWAEKVTAADRDGIKRFEFDTFKSDVRDYLDQYAEGREDAERCARIRRECLDELHHVEPDEAGAIAFIRDFSFEGFCFQDWERTSREFSFRFIWNCYAVQWAIARYDALKAAGREAANDDGSERVAA